MHSVNSKTSIFISNYFIFFLKIFGLYLLYFSLFRLYFLWTYGNGLSITNNLSDIIYAFITGLRFDLTVSCYGMIIPLLIISSTLFLPTKYLKYTSTIKKFILYYCIFLFTLFVLITFIDYYFYKFFQFRINILFFGIFNDDTKSVLKSVWSDYPVIKLTATMFILLSIFTYLIKIFFKEKIALPQFIQHKSNILLFAFMLLYFLAMRGTISLFPIRTENGIISENTFINNLTGNGVFFLKTAISEKKKQNINTDILQKLKENGFNSPKEALAAYLQINLSDSNSLHKALIVSTKRNEFLVQNPPNVVFIQMESFGSYYLDLHSSSLNLLGHLDEQMKYCILFRKFLSGTSGTIHSLEGLLVGTPLTPISQSTYLDRNLSSSVALPYKRAGYTTHFLTSAEMGWRNLDKFIPNQYFDNSEGCEILLKKNPKASRGEWGAYDEFLFDRTFEVLQKGTSPQFIFALTTTNHTPFSLPESYIPYPIQMTESIISKLRTNQNIAQKNFTNYQYANDCLGRFIEKVRNSPLGENTIIAASGDHNTLQLFSFSDQQLLDKYSVPFILYIPEKYQPKKSVNTEIFGSHKDIFPTLFNLSLSEANYLKTGVNLLDENNDKNFGIINFDVAMNNLGCVSISSPSCFIWADNSKKFLQTSNYIQNPMLKNLQLQAKAYKASLTYYIQNDLKNSSNKTELK